HHSLDPEQIQPGNRLLLDLTAAQEAARREGVRSTARLRARMGRSSYLGERAEGIPDPGAVGVGLLFASAQGVVTDLDTHLG
ncbi:DAK2 domain-containing protein, partial [Streptomyces albidoflavus]